MTDLRFHGNSTDDPLSRVLARPFLRQRFLKDLSLSASLKLHTIDERSWSLLNSISPPALQQKIFDHYLAGAGITQQTFRLLIPNVKLQNHPNKSVLKYLSPESGKMVTMRLSFPKIRACFCASRSTAPELMPAKMPSWRANSRTLA